MSVEPTLAGDEPKAEDEKPSLLSRLGSFLNDGLIMRTAFYGLAVGVAITLFLDYREMLKADDTAPVVTPRRDNPVLPAFIPQTDSDGEDRVQTPAPNITTPSETLNEAMTIKLESGGILRMTGFIDVGTAALFEKEIEGISEYVKIVELNSPGGSVFDALAISSKIRGFGWTTKVSAGALCASSCPLIFVGGTKRIAEAGSGIGVHQFFSFGEDTRSASEAISGTQSTTARITRHLKMMDVDPILWTHALETPPQQLYYFSRDELTEYKMVTD